MVTTGCCCNITVLSSTSSFILSILPLTTIFLEYILITTFDADFILFHQIDSVINLPHVVKFYATKKLPICSTLIILRTIMIFMKLYRIDTGFLLVCFGIICFSHLLKEFNTLYCFIPIRRSFNRESCSLTGFLTTICSNASS